MYERYWRLREKPFQNTADPRFFYKSSDHEEALMKLLYAIEHGLGSALLTGIFGCGKTVIAQALLQQLPSDRYKTAFITNPQFGYVELLRAIVRNLKAVELPIKKTELSADSLLELLGYILENNSRDGKETIVIIDEAHIINDQRIFEELRLLLNFQTKDKFLLTLFLLGQPELKQKIEDNKQFEQRIAIKCSLKALNLEDTQHYITHRLRVAGRDHDSIFDQGALRVIYNRSGGIPRRINRICDFSLLVGMDKRIETINEETVQESLQILEG